MTKADIRPSKVNDDDMLPDYDFSKGVRGKHAHRVGKPYSVKISNGDGTATIQQFDPSGYMTSEQRNVWTGDRVAGDKISGDKVIGDKVAGNKIQIGTVQGDAIAGNKIVNSQNLTQAAQDIKALLDQLAIDYPNEDEFIQGGRALSAIKKDPTLKTRLINAAKEAGIAAFEKTVEAITDNPAAGSIVAGIKGFIEADG
jgi:hypothetical protein